VKNGDFKIYVMDSVKDAVKVLMADEIHSVEDIFEIMPKELKKYNGKK
jgi:hypothetical protein